MVQTKMHHLLKKKQNVLSPLWMATETTYEYNTSP